MAQLLSMPFRISPAGQAVRVEQGDDEYYKQQLATILLTIQGERLLNEDLGMPDMAFDGFQYSTFRAQVQELLPEIQDIVATTQNVDEQNERVSIQFTVLPEQL